MHIEVWILERPQGQSPDEAWVKSQIGKAEPTKCPIGGHTMKVRKGAVYVFRKPKGGLRIVIPKESGVMEIRQDLIHELPNLFADLHQPPQRPEGSPIFDGVRHALRQMRYRLGIDD